MSGWTCANCGLQNTIVCDVCFELIGWDKIKCPSCGGALSEIRTDGKRFWRHCFSCHFEFEEKMNERANI